MSERAIEDEVTDLASQLHQLVSQLSVQSQHHLASALSAAVTPGINGVLVVEIPSRPNEQPLVKWLGGVKHLLLQL